MTTHRVNSANASEWQASTAYSLGNRVVCTSGYATVAARAVVFECTTGGTSGGSEPTWDYTPGNTTNDNTVVWTARDLTTWANATCYLLYAMNHASSDGDDIYVHNAHSESKDFGSNYGLNGATAHNNHKKIYCVDKDSGDALSTGAIVDNPNSMFGLVFKKNAYSYGVKYKCSSNASLEMSAENAFWIFEGAGTTVIFELDGTGSLYLGGTAPKRVRMILLNGSIDFGNVANSIEHARSSYFLWKGGSVTAANGLTSLFDMGSSYGGTQQAIVRDVDLSGVGAGATATSLVKVDQDQQYDITFERCKLPTDAGFTITTGNWTDTPAGRLRLHHCSSSNSTLDFKEDQYAGSVEDETSIYATTGAEHGSTHFSYKMVSSANTVDRVNALESPPIFSWTDQTGSTTFTIECNWDSATNIQDDEVWLEFEYPANNTDGLGARETDKVVPLGTPSDQAASTEGWTGTGGFSNENKFKLSVTVTPGKAGPVTARVYLAKPSTTVYVDPWISES